MHVCGLCLQTGPGGKKEEEEQQICLSLTPSPQTQPPMAREGGRERENCFGIRRPTVFHAILRRETSSSVGEILSLPTWLGGLGNFVGRSPSRSFAKRTRENKPCDLPLLWRSSHEVGGSVGATTATAHKTEKTTTTRA